MRFVVPTDHPCLPGHFPGNAIVPGVVILDQVLAVIEATHGPLGALRLPQVKFVQPLRPGQAARVELQTPRVVDEASAETSAQPSVAKWRFRVLRGDDLIASGEIATASA